MAREIVVHTIDTRQAEARRRLRELLDPAGGLSSKELGQRLAVQRTPGNAPLQLRAELTYLSSIAEKPAAKTGRAGLVPRYVEVVIVGDGAHPRTVARPTSDPAMDGVAVDPVAGTSSRLFTPLLTVSEREAQ